MVTLLNQTDLCALFRCNQVARRRPRFVLQTLLFFCLNTDSRRAPHSVVFGEVTEGMDIVKQIEGFGSQSGKTSQKVTIENCGECVPFLPSFSPSLASTAVY